MTARVPGPDQAIDGGGGHEGQLSQVEDDGLAGNRDLVDRILKILGGCQVELPSKD